MSTEWNDRLGLPFIPGYTFRDLEKTAYHRCQTLGYKNGFALSHRPSVVIGKDVLASEPLTHHDIDKLCFDTPYTVYDKPQHEEFIPAHVALDKKVLRFYGYFLEEIVYSPAEHYRVRPVTIYYYLEDDSMCIIEPSVVNSGLPQGKRIRRQRLPKNEYGNYYNWRDLNLAMDLEVYATKYHITDCDLFTKEFMESEGIILKEPEKTPEDPYIKHRSVKLTQEHVNTSPAKFEKLYRFLHMDSMVLRFYGQWVESDAYQSHTWPVIIHYYLVDDTVDVREAHQRNSGRDPFPLFMSRQKIPKKVKEESFPSIVMEISKDLVEEYYSPKDFQLGQKVKLLSHQFFLYDCDGFTREYYQKNYPEMEMKPVEIPKVEDTTKKTQVIPPYNGFGSLEDSLQYCYSLIPEPPRKNIMKRLVNSNKMLRYTAKLDSPYPEDRDRRFILTYHLDTDMISIYETPRRNSGIISGKFLGQCKVSKPGSTVDNPVYYTPADFVIGTTVEVFSHRFILTNADLYVLKYLESNPDEVPSQTLESLKQVLGAEMASSMPVEQKGEEK
ncbi:EF-hand domain-containing protein 1 isoform X2 [Poeciliopsis prolifica]|uniref:EF-hand domain-containing protein 1 isoform X2 n=1 Tax=Poeciliopsis prolifica TaxID=188132 RepID=UPI0024138B63|nr:EF-hand domain-containing protein 1 isoform X2 [Poeciliopsis prolifica]